MTTLYVLHAPGAGAFKVGITDDLPKRLASIQHSSPVPLVLVRTRRFSKRRAALMAEGRLERRLAHARRWGEWYDDTELALAGSPRQPALVIDLLAKKFPRYRRTWVAASVRLSDRRVALVRACSGSQTSWTSSGKPLQSAIVPAVPAPCPPVGGLGEETSRLLEVCW
jgi:hypothetical protein